VFHPLHPLRCALGRLFVHLVLVLVGGVAALCGQDDPAADAGAPPWYREAMSVIMRDSAAAQKIAEERLAAARAAGDATAEAYALLLLGASRGRVNDLPQMLGHTRTGLDLAERLGSPTLLLTALTVRAAAFRAAGDPAAAIDLFLRALPLAERLRARQTLRETLNGLARAYVDLGDKDRALEFAQQAFAAAEQSENPAAIAASATVLAATHRALGNRAEQRRFLNRALELQRAQGRSTELTDTEESLAMLDFREGRLTEALAALDRVEVRRRTLRGRSKLSQTLLNRAQVLTALGRLDEALASTEEARGYADAMDSPGVTAPVYSRLASVREARGEFAEALAAYKRAVAAENTIRGESARQKTAELQARYDISKKDEELARLARVNESKAAEERIRTAQLAATAAELRASEANLARTRAQRLALGAGIVGATVLLGALVFVQRARLRAERLALEETRRAQLLAEDAGVLKSRLLGIASHDLKGPLRSMLRSADTLEQHAADPQAVTSAAQLVRGHARQMSDLVRDLLDLSAIEGGDLALQKSPLDLARLAAEVASRHAARAAEKDQTLSVSAAAAPLPFVGDAARLAQAIDNLVDNAVKYTPAGGTITVTAERRGAHLCVAVADQGPGLGPEELGRLFQPFQRLSAQPTGGEASTGLGLHIARDFIARHDGSIEVDTAPGQGTTFTVLLPVAE
jgi:signal transduction histidine kinase